MKRAVACLFLVSVVAVATRSATAHHSFSAEYDRNKPITLAGVVTKVEWMNPHVYFYLDVKEASGVVVPWAIEGGAPNTLYRAGWRRDSLKAGDQLTVHAYLARDGSKLANMRSAILPDGRAVLGGQNDGGPTPTLPTAAKPPGRE
jgi:hypothetical protein